MSDIEIRALTKAYGGRAAVDNIDLSIGAGEFMVLVGPSGCGKTTALRMIAGFVDPTSGRIRIGGRDVIGLPPRRRNIGMVFQDYALFPSMTVAQNIAFGLEEHRVSADDIRRRVGEMLDLIQMQAMAERLPRELSGGQQQRVALARALAYKPSVLLMDEPFGALDQKLREDMQREFVGIQKQFGITTLFVTHDQQEAMALADRITVMQAGGIEQIGRPADLYKSPATLFAATFIGRSNQLRGKVTALSPGHATVALSSGESVTLRAGADGLALGGDAVCVVRPERFRVAGADGASENRLAVTLNRATHLGSFAEVMGATTDGTTVIVQMEPEAAGRLALGPVTLAFGRDDGFVFPAPPQARP